MSKDLSNKTLGIIHAAVFTAQTVQKYIDEIIPEVSVLHLGDDSIQRDNLRAPIGTIPKTNYFKFVTYARFLEEAGADLIMLGCSTFNRAVEMDLAVRDGRRIGLLATLAMTVPSSERLLRLAASEAGREVEITTVLSTEAFNVLRAGNPQKHNEMLLEEIDKLSRKVDAIVMAQVSMSVLEPQLKNTRVPVYNSGRTGFARAREILESLP